MSVVNTLKLFAVFGGWRFSAGALLSCVLHGALLVVIIVGWTPAEKPKTIIKPRFIEAKLLQMKPALIQPVKKQTKVTTKPASRPKVDDSARKKAQQKKRQQELKRKQQVKDKVEKKRRQELERQQRLKRQREEQQRQDEQRKKLKEQELAQALSLEDELLQSENDELVGTYSGYMASLIASNWNRPLSARRDMQVELQIFLGAAGRVTGVQVSRSSGHAAFDRSAEQAVWKVGQFQRLKEVETSLYQQYFRQITLVFSPDDLRK